MKQGTKFFLLIILLIVICYCILNKPQYPKNNLNKDKLITINPNLITSINKNIPQPTNLNTPDKKSLKFDSLSNFNKNSLITQNLSTQMGEDTNNKLLKDLPTFDSLSNQDSKRPSCLETQLLPDLLNYPFSKIPPKSLNQQECLSKRVNACPMSNYQQCTNNSPLSDYTTYDVCNCDGFSVTNLCPYKLQKQTSDVNIKLNCPLYNNQVPYTLVLP